MTHLTRHYTAAVGTMLAGLVVAGCQAPRPLHEWTLGLEEVATLGAEPVTSETAFFTPSSIGFDGNNRLYVLDSGNARVQVFSPSHRFVRTLGREGQAPGELSSPSSMWVYPDGEVIVSDTGNRRLQAFGPSGEPRDPVPLDYPPLDLVGTKDRIFVLRLPSASLLMGADTGPLLEIRGRDGDLLGEAISAQPADAGIVFFLLNMFQIAASPGEGFSIADMHRYSRIRGFDDEGRSLGEISILYKADVWAPLGYLPEDVNESSVARIARTSTDLHWDPRRRLFWVLSGYVDRSPDGEWTLAHEIYRYDAVGEYRGSLVLPTPAVAVSTAPDGKLWIVDVEGVVHGYRVTDPDLATADTWRDDP